MINAKVSVITDAIVLTPNILYQLYTEMNDTNPLINMKTDSSNRGTIYYNGSCTDLYGLPFLYVEFPNSY